jgi:hypothetical protein
MRRKNKKGTQKRVGEREGVGEAGREGVMPNNMNILQKIRMYVST